MKFLKSILFMISFAVIIVFITSCQSQSNQVKVSPSPEVNVQENKQSIGSIGKELNNDGLIINVKEVKKEKSYNGKTSSNGQFVVLTVQIINQTKSEVTYQQFQKKLNFIVNQKTYYPISSFTFLKNNKGDNITFNKEYEFSIAYDVEESTDYSFQIVGSSYFSSWKIS